MMSYGAISNTLRFYMQVLSVFEIPVIGLNIGLFVTSSGFVPIYIFCPLAGFLADTKFSRQKTIITSLYITLLSSIVMVAAGGFALPKVLQQEECNSTRMLYISMGFFVLSFVLLVVSFVGFTANVLQFGLDQLNDSPAEDQSLFIHWMVWVYYLAGIFSQLTQLMVTFIMLTILIPLLIISLCIAHRRKNWFTVDPLKVNPYTLMYKVTKFAYQNKVPVHRSAFTYCEDELPSGLNLAKNKYGGPFTTEQVEDVKSFYGIAKVLLIFGMAFFYSLAATNIIMEFPHKMKEDFYKTTYVKGKFFLFFDVLHSALPVTCIPLYICFIRPYFSHCMPGILKRMGIGMLLLLVALIYSSSLDTAYYIYGSSLNGSVYSNISGLEQKVSGMYISIFIPQCTLVSLANVIMPIALLEFICSQSPHSMKGLFIGLLIGNQGLLSLLSLPFLALKHYKPFYCGGLVYYLVNISLGVLFFILFVIAAKKYKYRERDEPSNERRYIEEYYSKLLAESKMDE